MSDVNLDSTTKDGLANLSRVSNFRYKMLFAQVQYDLQNAPAAKTPERVIMNALNAIYNTGIEVKPLNGEDEKRMAGTFIELFNSLMLMVTLQEAEKKQGEEDGKTNK